MTKNKEQLQIIESTQQVVKQMLQDDIKEYGEMAYEEFQCDCCGNFKPKAGSLMYGEYNLCNDCVLIAETSFNLKKIKSIKELIDSMEDDRFESTYKLIFEETNKT